MIERVISFAKPDVEDDEAALLESINGVAGRRCAEWLKAGLGQTLREADFDDAASPEDWGWAVIVRLGADLFVLGCSPDETVSNGWRVLVGDNYSRGVFPWTRKRKKASARLLADQTEAFLRSHPEVIGVRVYT